MSSSVPHAQKRKGNMNNRDLTRDFITDSVAASTKIPAGVCTYVDAALGRKVTDGAKAFGAVRFTEYEADNSNSTVIGTVKVSTFKSGAIVSLGSWRCNQRGRPRGIRSRRRRGSIYDSCKLYRCISWSS